MEQPKLDIPIPAPPWGSDFWRAPESPICTDPVTLRGCRFWAVCSERRQRLNNAALIAGESCPNYVQLAELDRKTAQIVTERGFTERGQL